MERGTSAKPSEATSRPAQAARVVLLMLACGAAVFAFTRGRDAGLTRAGYTCPMHREVTAASPGSCPICGMELTSIGVSRPAIAPSTVAPLHLPTGAVDTAHRRVFSFPVTAPAAVRDDGRVEAVLYDDDLAALMPGEQGVFRPSAAPAVRVAVSLTDGPAVPWDAATSRVAFGPGRGTPALPAGTVGWLELPERSRAALVVPSSAIVETPGGSQVLVLPPGATRFERRPVKLGKMPIGLAVVLSGLREDERVAVRSAFFLDAELRLGSGTGPTGR